MKLNGSPTKRLWKFTGKVLSVAQPWASAIAYAGKDVENRSWRTHYRGPLAIHASHTMYEDDLTRLLRTVRGGEKRTLVELITQGQEALGIDPGIFRGHIVAVAMLVDCVDRSASIWFRGRWGWALEGIVPIVPVPWVGRLGLLDCKFPYKPMIQSTER